MSVWSKITSGLKDFRRNKAGGVAMIFALAFTPVAFLSLVMIDFSRASTARSNLQETLDAATLLAARSTAITQDDVDKIGDAALAAQLPTNLGINGLTPNGQGRVANATFTPSANNTIVADATATVTPLVAGLFLGHDINIGAHSEVVRSMNKLEIAMVLDTTGSMAGSKISNLQDAADDFIDTMATAAAQSTITNPVKISIVPFASTVKVSAPVSLSAYSTTNFTATGLPTWLDGRARNVAWNNDLFTNASSTSARIDRFAMLKQMGVSWGGCVENRAAPYDVTDDPPTATGATASPTTAQAESMFVPYFWPDEPDMSWYTKVSFGNSGNDYLADGYAKTTKSSTLTSWRVAQGNSAKYTTSPKSGTNNVGGVYGPNSYCEMQQMQRLTNNFTLLKTTVAGLVAKGETNIPIGLAWGWHTISPNAPLSDGSAYGTTNLTKVIVLMTDGDNTMDPNSGDSANGSLYHGYGYIWQNKLGTTSGSASDRTAALNTRMSLLCSNIKAKGIVIYTVGVGVSSSSKSLLQACATTTSQYYDVNASGSNMDAAFSAIAGSIQNLRISK